MAKHSKSEVEEATENLRAHFLHKNTFRDRYGKPVMFAIVRHVASSGMSRVIEPLILTTEGPMYIRGQVSTILGLSRDPKHDGLRVGGVGMNMIFWMADALGSKIDVKLGYESL